METGAGVLLGYLTRPLMLLSRLLQVLLALSLWFPDPCVSEFDWQKKLQFGFIKPREKRHSPEGGHLPFLKAREIDTTG